MEISDQAWRFIVAFFLTVIVITAIGCDILDSVEAEFEISAVPKMEPYGFPYVIVTVKNVGSATGDGVSCDIKAIKEGHVVDEGFAYFRWGHSIAPGESASDEVWFTELKSHGDYDQLEYLLEWETVEARFLW